jgi:Reverse transcriptase (RNA-dependent DNA polymerase)/RNase H-like domain found in reverse transcriptase/Integrase zinc binding domain/Chromo (CHRromatin Organisation MOdifier) domain/Integrase core domain
MEFIEENLAAGRIRPSSSHIASGTWMIPKKDPTAVPRVVHDYRKLNDDTIKDHTPLPRQDEIIELLAKAKIRGKIDLVNAYYQIFMEATDIHKTAFKTPFGLYEWVVMPQGLCNAPATFQRYMNFVLRKYIGRFCAVYIDDIAIWSNSIEEHKEHVRLILEALEEAGITASKDKSILFADEIQFLGFTISSRGVEVDGEKVSKILSSRTPTSAHDIKQFNGLVNYIGQFIPGLSEWSTVLSSLTKKNAIFKWEPVHQQAFENIKRLTAATPICRPINHESLDPVMLVSDASNRALGGYYGQGKDYKTMVPAGFHSRALNSAEKNYPTHDKEMLAIVDCLKKWEPQLSGVHVDILTDHNSLKHWKTQKDLSPRQIRWNETYSRFDADIHHIPGIANSAADALSRYPYIQHLTPELQEVNAISTLEFDPSILKSVKKSYVTDSRFGPVISNPEQYPLYHIEDGFIFYEGRLCIPKNDRKIRETLLALYHDHQNHFGIPKTRQSIAKDYYWPGLENDIDQYIKSCASCARNKSSTQVPAGFLHPMPIPQSRFEELAIDFVGPLPKSNGFDTIFIMTDRLTNYVLIVPTHQTATAPDIAKLMYETWYRRFGLPKALTSDRDKLFISNFWKELHKKIGIKLRMSTSYHPETDGSSERSNKTAIEAVRHYVNTRQTDWADHLIHVETAMNNSVNATTKMSPTELLYGSPIRLFPTAKTTSKSDVPAVTDYIERIQDSIAIARDRHLDAKTNQTTQANKHRRKDPGYKVGDFVYLDTKNLRLRIKQKGRSAKFYPRYVGPFKVIKSKPATSTYKLELPPQYKIHPTFHSKRLKPAINNDPSLFPGREPAKPPPLDAKDNIYQAEQLLDHRKFGRTKKYLVHWEGYPDSEDSWELEKDIGPGLLEEYWEKVAKE